MALPTQSDQLLLEKIHCLPPDKVAEVIDFVEFLSQRQGDDSDHRLTEWAPALSASSFKEVWDNPEDDVYNSL